MTPRTVDDRRWLWLWLVRHGESRWNVQHRIQGHADDSGLTLRGRRQAVRLSRTLGRADIGTVYCSDLRRALQTAGPLARRLGLSIQRDARVRERSYGVLEGHPTTDLSAACWGIEGDRVVDVDARPPGGESLRQLAARCEQFLGWLGTQAHPADVVVIAHGGSVRALRAAVLGSPMGDMVWSPVANCSVVRLPLPGARAPGAEQTNGPSKQGDHDEPLDTGAARAIRQASRIGPDHDDRRGFAAPVLP